MSLGFKSHRRKGRMTLNLRRRRLLLRRKNWSGKWKMEKSRKKVDAHNTTGEDAWRGACHTGLSMLRVRGMNMTLARVCECVMDTSK